ncbi:MAG TPA: FkbM family methyltransferase [Reyranella sp.]|nr:FkbM family methyltransferase [Reyranella sp.]
MDGAFTTLVAGALDAPFRLLDIGCSGGLDPRWRAFGARLQAIGIDASRNECARLSKAERLADVEYVSAFVAGAAGRRIDPTRQASPLILAIRERLSFMRTREIRAERLAEAEIEEKLRHNAWEMTELADQDRPVLVHELLAARGWTDFDYLKIDIDGSDFEVLQTFDGRLAPSGVLGVQLEVNFVGTESPADHTFHNTDRFMRRQGYELLRLDVRNYSSRALPARYVWPTPAETLFGRPFQGEAWYARDFAGATLAPGKLLKLAAIYAAIGVPDMAAELLQQRRSEMAGLDIERGLDLLAAQVQPERVRKLDYRSYMRGFEADAAHFYRREGDYTWGERFAAAWAAFRKPRR